MLRVSLSVGVLLFALAVWPDGSGQRPAYYLESARSRATQHTVAPSAGAQHGVSKGVRDPGMAGRHQGGFVGRTAPGTHRDPDRSHQRPPRYGFGLPYYGMPYYNYLPYWGFVPYWQPYGYGTWPGFRPYFAPRYAYLIRPLPIIVTNMPVVFGGYCGPGRSFGVSVGGYWSW